MPAAVGDGERGLRGGAGVLLADARGVPTRGCQHDADAGAIGEVSRRANDRVDRPAITFEAKAAEVARASDDLEAAGRARAVGERLLALIAQAITASIAGVAEGLLRVRPRSGAGCSSTSARGGRLWSASTARGAARRCGLSAARRRAARARVRDEWDGRSARLGAASAARRAASIRDRAHAVRACPIRASRGGGAWHARAAWSVTSQ